MLFITLVVGRPFDKLRDRSRIPLDNLRQAQGPGGKLKNRATGSGTGKTGSETGSTSSGSGGDAVGDEFG